MLSDNIKKILRKQHYELVGDNGAVQICRWTKKSLLNRGFCYKEKFYNVKSHRCCQMSPFMACPNKCVHCWRPIELDFGFKLKSRYKNASEPKKLIENCIKAQRKLLSGFGGNTEVNKKKLQEAQNPNQFAISLIGEPTLYPYLAELILELKKQEKTSFLVTNGLFPEKIQELKKKKALPTQIYISLNTPNKKEYEKWHRSKLKDAWKRFNKSLKIMKNLDTKRVIRMTLVKNMNMQNEKEYAKLILKAMPDFIEVKGYMSVGFARKRIGYEKMPTHNEIKDFSKKLVKELESRRYKILDEKKESRVVLIGKDRRKIKIKKI